MQFTLKAKEPSIKYGRNHKEIITTYYSMMAANDVLRMDNDNKIITGLSKGPLIMADLVRICNTRSTGNFLLSMRRLIDTNYVEKKVNGNILYKLTESGERRFKRLKKEARNLFFR